LVMRFEFESLVQLAAFTFLGYMVVVNPYISEEFFATLSAWLLLLTVVGGGWPVSVPYGRPFKKIWVTGIVMTLLLLTASTASYALFIVIGLQHLMTTWFWVCANWAFVLDAWPVRHHTPKTAIIVGSVASMLAALALDYLLTLFSVKSLLPLFMVTQLAVAAIFSPFFVFQGYPFYRLWRQPRIGFAILLLSIAAGLGVTALPQNIHTLVTSLLSGVLLWSVLFSWSFAFPLTRQYGQPKRGLLTLPLVFVIAVAWSYSVSRLFPSIQFVTIQFKNDYSRILIVDRLLEKGIRCVASSSFNILRICFFNSGSLSLTVTQTSSKFTPKYP